MFLVIVQLCVPDYPAACGVMSLGIIILTFYQHALTFGWLICRLVMNYYILIRAVDVCAERPLPHQFKPDVADVCQL